MTSPTEVVRAVMAGVTQFVLGDATALDRLEEVYAEPTHVLHPMRPEIPPLVTHDDLRRHAARIGDRDRPDSHRAVDVVIHTTTDPEVVITEFRYETTMNGSTTTTPCIWVTRVRDGRIVEARDYNGTPHPVES